MRTFRAALQGDGLTVTAELTLTKSSTARDIQQQADMLGDLVDAIQVTDIPYAWVQMSSLSAATILINHGVDPIPILTCRDRNRIALQSDLLGLRALGVTSLVLMRGYQVPKRHSLPGSMVFELSGRELIELAAGVGEGSPPIPGEEFLIGTAANAFRPKRNWQAESLKAKAAAGARFMQTQLCFNPDMLRHYMKRLVEVKLTRDYSVMVSLAPLPSAVTATWLKNRMKEARIPAELIQRLEDAKDPEHEGIEICAEMMREISEIPGISGINLMTMGNAEAIAATIEASGLR
jgi:methylenetetrahydrofolate reductase (NADPH)